MSKWTHDARRAIRYSVTGREDGTGPMGDALCDRILDLEAELAEMRPVVEAVKAVCAAHDDCACSLCSALRAQREGK